ncbi:hypothetical protein RI367_008470 [Sorochytrium milnesiophthora]
MSLASPPQIASDAVTAPATMSAFDRPLPDLKPPSLEGTDTVSFLVWQKVILRYFRAYALDAYLTKTPEAVWRLESLPAKT